MFISRIILPRLTPPGAAPDSPEVRASVGIFAGSLSVVVNIALAVVKGAMAILTGSASLMADAIHTVSDLLTSIVVIIGFRISRKPADREHPFGHGRMEAVSALIVGVVLAIMSIEMLHTGIGRLANPKPIVVAPWVMALLVATIMAKELLAQVSSDLGKAIRSTALRADAMHQRSDAFSTVLVIIAFVGARYGVAWLDGAMAIGVAILIGHAAWRILYQSVNPLLGEQASPEMLREIEEIAASFHGVVGVHGIMVHHYGQNHVIGLHIEVPMADAIRLHYIGEALEDKLTRRFPGHAIVHIDPINITHPHYAEAHGLITELMDAHPLVSTFHDLRLLGGKLQFKIAFNIVPTRELDDTETDSLRDKILHHIQDLFPSAGLVMRIDSPYLGEPR
jgi:cation diffusion facilitator family transporter